MFPDNRHKMTVAHCTKELVKLKRIHRLHDYFSYRERIFFPVYRHTKQASRRRDMIFRRFFCKIFQRSKRTFTGLDLIKYEERLSRNDLFAEIFLQKTDQTVRLQITIEKLSDNRHPFKIDIYEILIIISSEILKRICLPYLPCAIQDQRHTVPFHVLPFQKFCSNISFHGDTFSHI